jgi:hypothetical protein
MNAPDLRSVFPRMQWTFDQARGVERDKCVRGDEVGFVEILGRTGLLYPFDRDSFTAWSEDPSTIRRFRRAGFVPRQDGDLETAFEVPPARLREAGRLVQVTEHFPGLAKSPPNKSLPFGFVARKRRTAPGTASEPGAAK